MSKPAKPTSKTSKKRIHRGGMPAGHRTVKTIAKEEARAAHRQVVLKHMERMTRSMVAAAIGIGHLFKRDSTGKFTKIEDDKEIERLMIEGTEGSHYWIFAKDPSVQAYTDLMNRAIDKPAEQEQQHSISGSVDFRWQDPSEVGRK